MRASSSLVLSILQVIEHKSTAQQLAVMKKEMEVLLELQLDHPNVVCLYKHSTRLKDMVRLRVPFICSLPETGTSGSLECYHAPYNSYVSCTTSSI